MLLHLNILQLGPLVIVGGNFPTLERPIGAPYWQFTFVIILSIVLMTLYFIDY
jgi:hypothetical protein